jgi:hypothetical protein
LRPLAGRIVVVVPIMTDENDTFAAACARADEKKRAADGFVDARPIFAKAKREAETIKARADAGPLAQILDGVHDFLGRFVIYPSREAHDAHVLWIAHAHVMDAWESTPRIAFLSPEAASGKTRALEVSELLVPNPVEAVNVSPAYLFR